jgi:hypothetical protein
MQMLFTDFLCWRGPELQRHLPEYFEADHTFLEVRLLVVIGRCFSC